MSLSDVSFWILGDMLSHQCGFSTGRTMFFRNVEKMTEQIVSEIIYSTSNCSVNSLLQTLFLSEYKMYRPPQLNTFYNNICVPNWQQQELVL